ncbi:MAG: helix-turn-helix domain-containing protein [Limisphaerales bacterium]
MKDQEIVNRFILHRAQGWSYNKLSQELNVSRQTLFNWSRKHRFEIANLRATELEELQNQLIQSREVRARAITEHLKKVEAELAKRSLDDVPTAKLYA